METTTNKSERIRIPDRLYFRIGDVAELVGVKPYVLRYWESEFPMIAPQKTSTGQRVYRRGDVETILMIKHLLYQERYSIEGARKRIRELKRDGELKNYKEKKVVAADSAAESSPDSPNDEAPRSRVATAAETASSSSLRREQMEKIRAISTELRALAKFPLEQLFRL